MSDCIPTAKDIEIAKKTIKKLYKYNIWDTVWLREKYPNRFTGFYERWELGVEMYENALAPEYTIQYDEDPRWIIREKILPKSET